VNRSAAIGNMRERIERLFSVTGHYKRPLAVGIDIILVLLSLYFSYLIRLGSIEALARYLSQILFIGMLIVPVKILVFWLFRLYHISFRYISLREVLAILKAAALTSPVIALIALVFRDLEIFAGFPRTVNWN